MESGNLEGHLSDTNEKFEVGMIRSTSDGNAQIVFIGGYGDPNDLELELLRTGKQQKSTIISSLGVLTLSARQNTPDHFKFIAEKNSVNNEAWFFENKSRKEAEVLLLSDKNLRGTFLVRPSGQFPNEFSISQKCYTDTKGNYVKHYKINGTTNGGFYLDYFREFDSLKNLISAYSKNKYGLCTVLSPPCPKPPPQLWDLLPEYRDNWEIPRSDIKLIRKLGSGSFGDVYYGMWQNKTEVAVKMLHKGIMAKVDFLEEASIMKKIRHKNLVTLYAVCTKEDPIYIIQEYMPKGDLLRYLRSNEKTLQFKDLVYIATQIASGMEYLESKKLIHRDLAARNVVMGEKNTTKICDFGLARVINNTNYYAKNLIFSIKWTAPEGLLHHKFSLKSDVWSYGILLMEIFTFGQEPYPGIPNMLVVLKVSTGYRMPKPTKHNFPDDIYKKMLECWNILPERRPTFKDLKLYFDKYYRNLN